MTTTANDAETRTIDFALLNRVAEALFGDPETVELGMELSQAIIDDASRRVAQDGGTDEQAGENRPPTFPQAVYDAYNAAKGCGGPGQRMRFSGREIDGMPYPAVCRTVRAALGDDEFDRLMNDHGFMRWAASAPKS